MIDLPGSVVVVGTGLIGTSVALALCEQGVPVWLADRDPAAVALAVDIGAGQRLRRRCARRPGRRGRARCPARGRRG